MEVNSRFQDPEKVSLSPEWRCPFSGGNKYKDYVNFFFGAKFLNWFCKRGCPVSSPVCCKHCNCYDFLSMNNQYR